MLEMFIPPLRGSTYVIPFDYYHAQGMQGVIFDIDNTLVPHDAPADGQAVGLFERLRAMGMKTCLLSNNKEPRVKPFADLVGSCYIHKAGKRESGDMRRPWSLWGRTGIIPSLWGTSCLRMCGAPGMRGCTAFLLSPSTKGRGTDRPEALSGKIVLHFYKKKLEKEGRKDD